MRLRSDHESEAGREKGTEGLMGERWRSKIERERDEVMGRMKNGW